MMKKKNKWMIGGIIALVLIITGVSSYFLLHKEKKETSIVTGFDPETGLSTGWQPVDYGFTQSVFDCYNFDSKYSSYMKECSVKIYMPCTAKTCVSVSSQVWDTCKKDGAFVEQDANCNYINGWNCKGYQYSCPSSSYVISRPSPLSPLTGTFSAYTGWRGTNQTTAWIEIPLNSEVVASGAWIEYNKMVMLGCADIGLEPANVTLCEASTRRPYKWVDKNNDGCGGASVDYREFSSPCPSGTECVPYQGCQASGCSVATNGAITCTSDLKAQKVCTYSGGIWLWAQTACVGDATCVEGQGCKCTSGTPCPTGMAVGDYMCDANGLYQQCMNKNGCIQLTAATSCGAGQICQLQTDKKILPCVCKPDERSWGTCSNSRIGDETCVNVNGINEIKECKKDTASTTVLTCPYWHNKTTCSIGQSCVEVTYGITGVRDFQCACPSGQCSKDTKGCNSLSQEWYCDMSLQPTGTCGIKKSNNCQQGFTCVDNQGCQCVNECTADGVSGCVAAPGGGFYPAKCTTHLYQVGTSMMSCNYWEPQSQSTCEQDKMYCDMVSSSPTYGKCIPPFTVTFSSPSNFKYPIAGKFEITATLSKPYGDINLQNALVKFEVVKNQEDTSTIASCDWKSSFTKTWTCTIAQGLTGITDGQYYVRIYVQEAQTYGPFYQPVTIGNAIAIYPLSALITTQYNDKPITFGVEMKYPNNNVVTDSDVYNYQWYAKYRVGSPTATQKDMGTPVYRSGSFNWEFNEKTEGRLYIEVKPSMKSTDYVVDTFKYDRITIVKPSVVIKMTSPSAFPAWVDQGKSLTFNWQCVNQGTNEAIACNIKKAVIHTPNGAEISVLSQVGGSGSTYHLTYTFTETPSYHVEIVAEATGFKDALSCPDNTDGAGGTYMGCPISVRTTPPPYWLYGIIAFVVLVIIVAVVIKMRGGRRR